MSWTGVVFISFLDARFSTMGRLTLNLRLHDFSMFFQVKTLKPLSTLKLQQLISLMEEESFANEEYIATEGEMGEKFFMIVHGSVSAWHKTSILV